MISTLQQGLIFQNECVKFVTIGTGGQVEFAAPLTDEERRDYEIHIHGQYDFAPALQMKSYLITRAVEYLHVEFSIRSGRVVNDPLFWYVIGGLDLRKMGVAEPLFLIPSEVLHTRAAPRRRGSIWYFQLALSLDPKVHDKWEPYRVPTLDLGKKVLEIMTDLRKHERRIKDVTLALPPAGTGTLWLRKAA